MSSPFIADASLVGTWCFENEASPQTDLLLDQLEDTSIVVPALFLFEIQNMLRKGERDGKISLAKSNAFWELLQSFDVRVEPVLSLSAHPVLLEGNMASLRMTQPILTLRVGQGFRSPHLTKTLFAFAE